MRILNWVQNKISGRNEMKRFSTGSSSGSAHYNAVPDSQKEEFSDWPHGLLAIGTFGNNELREDSQRHTFSESSHSSRDLPDFTQEEVSKLQKELTKLLALKPKSSAHGSETGVGGNSNLPLDKFLNCPSSLEIGRKICQQICEDLENGDDGDLSPDTKIILNRAKDVLADSRNTIRQKSFSFLPKKLFSCRRGFAPAPSLRDPLPESRMEKLLKAILYRKIYTRSSAPAVKKYLEKKPVDKTDKEGKAQGKADDGCKWVKTDSEYIVLEI